MRVWIDLSGKSAAAFGCGDSEYMYFCGAVDLLEERLEERGAKVLSRNPPLKKGDFRLFSPFGKGVTGGIFQFVNFWI
jgi:flavodoxin